MALDPVTASVATFAAKELISKTVGQTYSFIIKKYELTQLEKFKSQYVDHCAKLLQINTLATPGRSVFINDIYVPLTLKGLNTYTTTVTDSTTLDVERAVLIKGLAGMGKSTILRKLLANNARKHDRLPIFYELKNYRGGAIEAALAASLTNVGISLNASQVESILSDSNVKLYLDAFDESPTQFRDQLLDEINRIINRYNCHLICTTRPDTELDSLTDIETYAVDDLTQEQIVGIIEKTSADEEKAKSLSDAIARSRFNKESGSILKSPILVVLFCVSYNLGEEIPETLSQFYANIFDTVFFRHDNLKGKVNRVRHWNDNRRIYRALFEYLCFISQRSGVSSFSRDALVDFVSDSLRFMNEDESVADKIADELTSITNLIIVDGYNEYRYVHKSIQEFFASAFVCTLSPEKKHGFYRKCRQDSSFQSMFSNTLFFLEEIDYYDYAEAYLVPGVSDLLALEKKEITSSFSPKSDLIDGFLDSAMLRAKRVKTYVNKLKKYVVDDSLSLPSIDNDLSMSYFQEKLYSFPHSFLIFDGHNKHIINFIMEEGDILEGSTEDEEIRQVSLRKSLKILGVNRKEIEDSLIIAVGVLYQKKYNKALNDLCNRVKQIDGQGYLDF